MDNNVLYGFAVYFDGLRNWSPKSIVLLTLVKNSNDEYVCEKHDIVVYGPGEAVFIDTPKSGELYGRTMKMFTSFNRDDLELVVQGFNLGFWDR